MRSTLLIEFAFLAVAAGAIVAVMAWRTMRPFWRSFILAAVVAFASLVIARLLGWVSGLVALPVGFVLSLILVMLIIGKKKAATSPGTGEGKGRGASKGNEVGSRRVAEVTAKTTIRMVPTDTPPATKATSTPADSHPPEPVAQVVHVVPSSDKAPKA